MGNTQSYVVGSLFVSTAYFLYAQIYCSYTSLKSSVVNCDKLPSSVYLFIKYLSKALIRTQGQMYNTEKTEVIYTVLNCRLDSSLLRRFCRAAGYGWDYPDGEHRDVPLCFPETLLLRPLLMILTDGNFKLSPVGLVRVCQTLKTLQPVDELKKGPFTLQVRVLNYRHVNAGVEVDVCLSAISRSSCLVWESVLTLMSKNKLHTTCLPVYEIKNAPDEADDVKQVEVRVPRMTSMQCVCFPFDYSPFQLLSLPAFGFRLKIPPSVWMLSVCLAEIEKHKGVKVITAPASITAHFAHPLSAWGKLMIRFWETGSPFSARGLSFHIQQHGCSKSHLVGHISRSDDP